MIRRLGRRSNLVRVIDDVQDEGTASRFDFGLEGGCGRNDRFAQTTEERSEERRRKGCCVIMTCTPSGELPSLIHGKLLLTYE